MGQELIVPVEDRGDGVSHEEAFVKGALDLNLVIAKWLECAART